MTQELEDEDKKLEEDRKKYAYDITQKLTYFVITAELAICGYMLLNAHTLIKICGSPYLFLTCGLAALLGILWRFCYNITYHSHSHARKSGKFDTNSEQLKTATYLAASKFQTSLHNTYAFLTVVVFLWILVAGFLYLYTLV